MHEDMHELSLSITQGLADFLSEKSPEKILRMVRMTTKS